MTRNFQKMIIYILFVWFYMMLCNIFVSTETTALQKLTNQSIQSALIRNINREQISSFSNHRKQYLYSNSMNKKSSITRIKRNEDISDRISEIKCREYSEMTRKIVWIMKKVPIPIRLKCKRPINLLIVGGEMTKPNEFPHMVALGVSLDESTTEYFCGGSLVSERWILTAAHCTSGTRGPPTVALLGSTNLNKMNELNDGQLLSISRTLLHPDYHPPRLYADLALLELAEPVGFSASIKPACLYSIPDSDPKRLWVSGWGAPSASSAGDSPTGANLTKAQLQLVDCARFGRLYRDELLLPHGIDPGSQLCAGDPRGGWRRDTCAGDSGVPLQARHPLGCLNEVIAVTSFGISCAMPEVPGIYTRISHYVDWIESVVWPSEQ